MINASVYIAFCSAKNRTRTRLCRLREPRYLIGAIVGVAYLYFTVFAQGRRPGIRAGRGRTRGNRPPFELLSAMQMAGTSLAALAFAVFAAVAWVLPMRSGLLEFSKAETAFLFPAPVSRRQLLVHRIVRSQIGSLVAAAFIAIFATPVSGLGRLRLAFGMWLLFVTARIYFAAVTLTRARLNAPSAAARRIAWLPIGALVTGVAIVGVSIARQFAQPAGSISDVVVRLSRATASGVPNMVLRPFILMLRPPLSTTLPSFLAALGWSLCVLGVVTAWLLLSDGMFDAVAGESGAQETKETRAHLSTPSARQVGWTLAPSGRIESLLLWKNAMQTIRGTGAGFWRYALPALGVLVATSAGGMSANGMRGPAGFFSMCSILVALGAVLFGPQMMRLDLRSDFEHLDVLKTWPARGADVIRGEMAWPALAVSIVACLAIVVAGIFSGTALPEVRFVSRWSFAIAAAFTAPALIAAQFVVHNAATIFFPAWVQLGRQRTRGIDAMGQRLIMLAAILLALLLFAVPGAVAGGTVWLVFHRMTGDVIYVPIAMLFAAIVFVEVLVVTELLGPAYERIDLMSIERAE